MQGSRMLANAAHALDDRQAPSLISIRAPNASGAADSARADASLRAHAASMQRAGVGSR